MKRALLIAVFMALCCEAVARERKPVKTSLAEYLARVPQSALAANEPALGSLWTGATAFASLATDYKARSVGDVVVVEIVEQTVTENANAVNTQRGFATESGVNGLAGRINTRGIEQLLSLNSNSKLQGQGQTASKSELRTRIAGQVVAVLNNGSLVVQAERNVLVSNEKQSVVLRGIARPGDLSADNVVRSTSLAGLEIEIKGKGVISDATRPPNWLVRMLLRVVGF